MNRSYLFIPAFNAGMVLSSLVLPADAIIFDLEDGVAFNQKESARDLLKHALHTLNFNHKDIFVRVNDCNSSFFKEDVALCTHPQVTGIVLPKANMQALKQLEANQKEIKPTILLIESALGVLEMESMAKAGSNVVGLLLGGEDLSSDLEVERTIEGQEIDFARKMLVLVAKAYGLVAIDTPYVDIDNVLGCQQEAKVASSLGYDGKVAINPRQLEAIHQGFALDSHVVSYALELIELFEQNKEKGIGVFSFNGKMVDEPIYQKAKKLVLKAKKQGVIK